MALDFEKEMRESLLEYKAVCDQMDDLKKKKDKIRNQSKQWLAMNKLDEAYLEDADEQAWKIANSSASRKKIKDWGLLRELIGDRYDDIVTHYDCETFKISKIKGLPVQG